MIRVGLAALLILQSAQEPLDAVRAAIKATAERSYAYTVRGRFSREGVYEPPDVLTARIDGFQSARHGATILVKGPEGLWKTPDERIGEKVEGTPADVADKVKSLREAEPPHAMLTTLIKDAKSGAETASGFLFVYDPEKVRTALDLQLDRAVERKSIPKPDKVDWESAAGHLWVQIDKATGTLTRFSEKRSVRIIYKRRGEADETKKYGTEMEFELSGHGTATIELPAEVRKRLGLK